MNKVTKSHLLLLMTAIIWGTGFVAQKAGAVLEPFTYNGLRSLIGGLALIPVVFIFSSKKGHTGEKSDHQYDPKTQNKAGLICGILLGISCSLQQAGLHFQSSVPRAAFITTLYIVIVPLLGMIVGKKTHKLIWLCVLTGVVGFFFLTMVGKNAGFHLDIGDLLVLICAFSFSCHIIAVDHFSPKCDGVRLSCMQFLVAGVGCLICMFLFEHPDINKILDCWLPILYCGVISSAGGYTLQILGQKHAEPATASLIMSLEAVFAVIFGILLLNESMTFFEFIGCVLIFAAVILSQIVDRKINS